MLVVVATVLTLFAGPLLATSSISITRTSGSILYVHPSTAVVDGYVSYEITNGGSAISDAWAKIDGLGSITLASHENGLYHIGALGSGATKPAFFYLKASGAVSAETHTHLLRLQRQARQRRYRGRQPVVLARYGDLSGGQHTFAVEAVDPAGNTSSPETYTWTIDTTAPDVAITVHPADPSTSSNADFAFGSNDATATLDCKLDGGDSPDGNTGLADGTHTFTVEATDPAGNTSDPASYTWTIDTTAPDVGITSHPDDPSGSGTGAFGFGSHDTTATFECKLDAGSYGSCASVETFDGLADGVHTFSVEAADPVGNTSAPATFT